MNVGDISLPTKKSLQLQLEQVISILINEDASYRPHTVDGIPGSMLDFQKKLPAVLIPDLHARPLCLDAILNYTLPESFVHHSPLTVTEALKEKLIYVICLGDGLHSELRGKQRWLQAGNDYIKDGFHSKKTMSTFMKEEMAEGLSLMSLVIKNKCLFPENFHFLKGNHENILNNDTLGDRAFRKFAAEGAMTHNFMETMYGNNLLELYSQFEHSLPYFVRTPTFLASHAEPLHAFSLKELVNAASSDITAFGLTWTANGEADSGSVSVMLKKLLSSNKDAFYFGGHRPVLNELYALRCDGKYVQIHNPFKCEATFVPDDRIFNPKIDILEITNG